MKNITHNVDESIYEVLENTDQFVCQHAHAYTLTPDPNDPKWEIITYYRDVRVPLPTYIRKYEDGVGVRWDKGPENNWLEDLKNIEL